MKLSTTLVTLALAVSRSYAAVPLWGQCGGEYYTGETTCESGTSCVVFDQWYSQCQAAALVSSSTTPAAPVTTSPPISTSSSPAAPVSSPLSTTTNVAPTLTAIPTPGTTGFIGVSGEQFILNGSKFTVVGTNSYWVGLGGYDEADMNKAFADMAGAGATVVRTWGFRDVIEPEGIYYQSWSGNNPIINTGADGLKHFDKMIAAAKANGIHLIVALTNNWKDFGGMDVYVDQILGKGKAHDLFYTDVSVKAAFKDYIKSFVTRYANDPTILGWELANEPRCTGADSNAKTGTCTPATISAWAKEMSAFVKSIDKNHLVALGDEGFYNQPGHPAYPYQGSEGIDFDANLKIDTLDFGTFHSYPEHWGQKDNITAFGAQWILDHAASQKSVGKPVIIEEYGSTIDPVAVYKEWHSKIVESGLSGSLYWQAGSHFASGSTHDDGFAIFPDSSVYTEILRHANALKARKV